MYLKYIAQRVKNWEGRTVTQVLSKLRRMMIEGDTVCLLAGKYVVWCKVVQVVHSWMCQRRHRNSSYKECMDAICSLVRVP